MKKISLQWRLTCIITLYIAVICGCLTLLVYKNGIYYIDSLQETVDARGDDAGVLHIDIQWFLANCEDADKVVSFITKSVLDELRDIYPEVLSQDVVTFPDALSRVKECTG